MDSVSC